MATLDSKVPSGPLADKWRKHKVDIKLVNPANKRKYEVIVVGAGLAGSSAASSLADMGYKAAIDAMTYLLASFHFAKLAYGEVKRTGGYTGLSEKECIAARHEIETLVGLDAFYEIEEQTVEKKKWNKR